MLKRMIGWTMLMVLTGVATARLRGVVDPAIPPGEWHGVLSGLFVVVTCRCWPGHCAPLPAIWWSCWHRSGFRPPGSRCAMRAQRGYLLLALVLVLFLLLALAIVVVVVV